MVERTASAAGFVFLGLLATLGLPESARRDDEPEPDEPSPQVAAA